MCDVNHIKRARYSCHVIEPVLQTLLNDAYSAIGDDSSLDIWVEEQKKISVIFIIQILSWNTGTFDTYQYFCTITERS